MRGVTIVVVALFIILGALLSKGEKKLSEKGRKAVFGMIMINSVVNDMPVNSHITDVISGKGGFRRS